MRYTNYKNGDPPMTNQYVITEDELEEWETGGMCWSEEKDLHTSIRSRPLPEELRKEKERVIDIILGWMHLYFTPDVLKHIKELRDKP